MTEVAHDLQVGWYSGASGCESGRLAKHFVCGAVQRLLSCVGEAVLL